MLGFLVLFLLAYIVFLHARQVRQGLSKAERPEFVYDKPELPKALKPVADRLDRWLRDGRITEEEHGRLMALVEADAAKEGWKSA